MTITPHELIRAQEQRRLEALVATAAITRDAHTAKLREALENLAEFLGMQVIGEAIVAKG